MPSLDPHRLAQDLQHRARAVRDTLAEDPRVGPFVDRELDIPLPFVGGDDIRLVLLGQDPTIQRAAQRCHVRTVLNLDRRGSLRRYLTDVVDALGLTLAQVYATNVARCFFTAPPTELARTQGLDVIRASADHWLPLLHEELACFPDALVISLGQPVLPTLVRDGHPQIMRHYWGYDVRWREGARAPFRRVEAEASALERPLHPLVHIGARGPFYRARRAEYLAFVRGYFSR
ncbi:MAG: hypothetical protein H6742_19575 [Alphaproteobacteria bacterium]|nr:hypothetical protein [Alphaproteobacteria bacterium]